MVDQLLRIRSIGIRSFGFLWFLLITVRLIQNDHGAEGCFLIILAQIIFNMQERYRELFKDEIEEKLKLHPYHNPGG